MTADTTTNIALGSLTGTKGAGTGKDKTGGFTF
jgi:hypothetical protein